MKKLKLHSTTPTGFPLQQWASAAIQWDHHSSIQINRAVHIQAIRRFFSIISKMGDGPLWTAAILCVPVFADNGWTAMFQMSLMALLGLGIYKLIKHFTSRPRPFVQHREITLGCPPLDQFSFPSGHTLHAVGLTTLFCYHFPTVGVLLVPFAALVALSRVILGLHFVSDVLMGAGIGLSLALLIIS
ncbi:membrane-associated phospholipid phosphatase [gamma proteobacterium HTCC5015]|nr:membrane-associated phospholipid phosphatase [gamma proteobacterium HTCC5015]